MLEATKTKWVSRFVARSEYKKSVRLNLLTQLLELIPYKIIKQPKVRLPKRKIGDYKAIDYPFKYFAERF
jgi:polyphosphate kinase